MALDRPSSKASLPTSSNPGTVPSSPLVRTPSHAPTPEVVETKTAIRGRHDRSGRKMVNQYVVMEQIGKGMHGTVRKGIDVRTSEFVAIKIVERVPKHRRLGMNAKPPPGSRPHARIGPGVVNQAMRTTEDKIKREIAIMKKCHHPNVVQLKEVIDDPHNSRIFLVLEFMEEGEIKWRTGPPDDLPLLAVEQTRLVFRQVILGLEYLHYQGVIHRDIKPANLLVKSDGTVKISDFGVSHFSYALRLASAGANTIRSSSPSPRRPTPREDDPNAPFPIPPPAEVEDVLMDESDLCKTAGSPAFFAPELCHQGGFGSLPSFGGPSSVPGLGPTFGSGSEERIGSTPSSAPSANSLSVPFDRPVPLRSASSSSSQTRRLTPLTPPSSSSRPRPIPTRQESGSSSTPPVPIPSSPSTPTAASVPSMATDISPPITEAIDVWALGVTLYCLLFGRPPFTAPTEYMLYKVIPKADFEIPDRMGSDGVPTGGRRITREPRRRTRKGKSNASGSESERDQDDYREGYEVVRILEQLLEKDATTRITLQYLKRTSWVLRDIPDPETWLAETDPRREEMVVIKQEDVEGAFRAARFKDTFRKMKEKTKSAIGIIGRLRSRSTSSVNVLGGPSANSITTDPDTPRADIQYPQSTSGGHTTPTPTAQPQMKTPPPLTLKKSYRASYSAVQTLTVRTRSGKSREASPARSPLSRHAPYGSRAEHALENENVETPRSGSPVQMSASRADSSGNLNYLGDETEVPVYSSDGPISSRTPKPRRSSATALLSPPEGSSGHVRRTSSLSASTRDSVDEIPPAGPTTAPLLQGRGAPRRNKTEPDKTPAQTPASSPGADGKEKSSRKMGWLSRLGHKGKKKVAPAATTTIAGQMSAGPSNPRSIDIFEASLDASLRYRESHEGLTDDSSAGGLSRHSLSPVASRDLRSQGASYRQWRNSPRDPYHDTDETGDEGHFSTDTRLSFSFSDDSEGEDYEDATPALMTGAGGYPAMRNRGLGWEPLYPQADPGSHHGSSSASSPGQSPLGSAYHSTATMSGQGHSYARPLNLSGELLASLTAQGPGPFHYPSSSPLAFQSFTHEAPRRGSATDDIEEHDFEDGPADEDDDDDFIEVRPRGSEGRARSSESERHRL